LRVSVNRLGTAAQAGAITGLFGLLGVVEKVHVFAAGAFGRTRRTAEDSSARNREDESSVVRGVAGGNGFPSAGVGLNGHLG
jgi:hypothetical protein